jgi:hypothetical protein
LRQLLRSGKSAVTGVNENDIIINKSFMKDKKAKAFLSCIEKKPTTIINKKKKGVEK